MVQLRFSLINLYGNKQTQSLGKQWGHVGLSRTVYDNSPVCTTRGPKTHAIGQTVKFLKMHTARDTTVDNKFTHVCVVPITTTQVGEDGDDEDVEGQ
jgi:hypothetical protein